MNYTSKNFIYMVAYAMWELGKMATIKVKCPKCGMEVDAPDNLERVFCLGCGSPINVKAPGAPQENVDRCMKCGNIITLENRRHKCSVCGNEFCEQCQEPHVPPEPDKITVDVHYRYRFYTETRWFVDVAHFPETLPSPLCSACYENEFEKAIQRAKTKIKAWRAELAKDEEIKILKEEYPQPKKKKLETAREFLKLISSGEE
ncbi:MAG: FYVE zinc finger domain-containing protein [Thermoplasmata archaeon]